MLQLTHSLPGGPAVTVTHNDIEEHAVLYLAQWAMCQHLPSPHEPSVTVSACLWEYSFISSSRAILPLVQRQLKPCTAISLGGLRALRAISKGQS